MMLTKLAHLKQDSYIRIVENKTATMPITIDNH
jgi:hypothetical protein